MRYKPWRVIDTDQEKRYCRCFACERYYGCRVRPRELVYVAQPVQIGSIELDPGWYCMECLWRSRRPD